MDLGLRMEPKVGLIRMIKRAHRKLAPKKTILFAMVTILTACGSSSDQQVATTFGPKTDETESTISETDSISNATRPPSTGIDLEVPSIDLQSLWGPMDGTKEPHCEGELQESQALLNARVEIRSLPNNEKKLCLVRKNADSTWATFAMTALPDHNYLAMGKDQRYDCTDKLVAIIDKQPRTFGFIIVQLVRYWACHGDAGGTYQQGVIALFVDARDPTTQTRLVPGLEITNFEEPSGIAYTTQFQFCAATGFCKSYSLKDDEITETDTYQLSVLSRGNALYVHDRTLKFSITAMPESVMFEPRSIPCIAYQLCEEK